MTNPELRRLATEFLSVPDAKPVEKNDLVFLGKTLWPLSYGVASEDDAAFAALSQTSLELIQEGKLLGTLISSSLYLPAEHISTLACARWADQAFPVVNMGHRYAAALLATGLSPEQAEEVRPPFHAFLIELPPGLLSVTDAQGQERELKLFLVHHLKSSKGMKWNYIAFASDSTLNIWVHSATSAQLLSEETPASSWLEGTAFIPTDERDKRLNLLLGRLILNTCLAMSNKDNVKKVGPSHKATAKALREHPEPKTRTFMVGKPIRLDLRDTVRSYLQGERLPPAVQTLVRGHWRRVVHGTGRSERRWQWIQPFWRGPEEAPILVRPHELKENDEK